MPATNVRVNMLGDSSSLVRAGRTAVRTLRSVGQSAARITGQITRIGAVAGLAATAGLLKLGKDSTESLDKLSKTSTRLDLPIRQVQELQLAGELAGIGGEKLTKAYQQMTRVLGDARRGSGAAAAAFEDLGLNISEIEHVLAPGITLRQFAEAINKIADPTRQASTLAFIFGREWRQILTLFRDIEGTFGRAEHFYQHLGTSLERAGKSAAIFQDNATLLGSIFTGLRDQVSGELLQRLNNVIAAVGEITLLWIDSQGGAAALGKVIAEDLVGAFRDLIKFGRNVKTVLDPIFGFFKFLGRSGNFFAELYGGVAAAGSAIARGEFGGARRIASDLGAHLASLPEVFTGAGAEGERAPTEELTRQTSLLEQILAAIENEGAVAFQ